VERFNPRDYWEDRLKKNSGLHGTGFLGLGKQYNNWLYKIKRKTFVKIMNKLKLDLKKFNVIDIGSGTGFYIELWKMLGVRKITGSDITHISVENLQKKFPKNEFYQLDIGDSPLMLKEKYEIVSAFDVLYHIVDDNRFNMAIKNIYELLQQGGLFIFSDNFLHYKTMRAENQVCRSLLDIENILTKTGFTIIKRSPQYVLMNNPIDSENKFRKFLWSLIALPIRSNETLGFIFGAVLYPFEFVLTSILKESSSTEIMICKKE